MEKIDNEYKVELMLYDYDSFTEFMKLVEKFRVNQRKKELKLILKSSIGKYWKRLGYSDEQIYEKIKSQYIEINGPIGENNNQSGNSINSSHNS